MGAASTSVFSEINKTLVKFYQSDGQEICLDTALDPKEGAAAEPPYDSMLEAHIAKRYVN